MWRWLRLFLIFWVGIFTVSFITVETEMDMFHRIGATAVLAVVAPLLMVFRNKGSYSAERRSRRKVGDLLIHCPWDPTILYRIEDQKVFMGMDQVPIYEIKGNKIYPCLRSEPAYRIEGDKVCRGADAAPFLEIREDKVFHITSRKLAYEIEALW